MHIADQLPLVFKSQLIATELPKTKSVISDLIPSCP